MNYNNLVVHKFVPFLNSHKNDKVVKIVTMKSERKFVFLAEKVGEFILEDQ